MVYQVAMVPGSLGIATQSADNVRTTRSTPEKGNENAVESRSGRKGVEHYQERVTTKANEATRSRGRGEGAIMNSLKNSGCP